LFHYFLDIEWGLKVKVCSTQLELERGKVRGKKYVAMKKAQLSPDSFEKLMG
jgi:hypothetical protein